MEIYSYSFLILLLPALSFVILALAGMKMSHKTAGLIGTTSLGLVTVLSYVTAFVYFGADRLADGTVRIVDYKTGKDETTFSLSPGLTDLFNNANSKRRKAILQLFLYSYAYLLEHKKTERVTPFIYKIGSMKDSGVRYKPQSRSRQPAEQFVFSMDNAVASEFITRMGETISDLYGKAFEQADEDSTACSYCRFIDICRRVPPKQYF